MSTTMLATTTANEANSTIPMMTGRSCWLMASIDGLAEAGQAEHGLGDDDAADEGPHVDAELGDDRGHARAQRVPDDDPALADALGPRGADVVLAEHVEHRGPGEPGVGGGRRRARA